jgi:hypothetical protein
MNGINIDRMSGSFQNELRKIAAKRIKVKTSGLKSMLLPAVAGIAAWEGLKKVDKDRRLGREMRRRQQGGW